VAVFIVGILCMCKICLYGGSVSKSRLQNEEQYYIEKFHR